MASKKEVFETTLNQVTELCTKHKTPNGFNEALAEIITVNLAPKAAGQSVNIDEVTKKNEAGEIVEILDAVSGKWLPATKEYFYEDKNGKGINGLKRISRQGEMVRKQHAKQLRATEQAIMADVLDGTITPEEGKAKLEQAKASKPDFSKVGLIVPEAPEAE